MLRSWEGGCVVICAGFVEDVEGEGAVGEDHAKRGGHDGVPVGVLDGRQRGLSGGDLHERLLFQIAIDKRPGVNQKGFIKLL